MRIEKSAHPSRPLRVREFQDKVVKKPAAKAPAKRKTGKSRFVAPYYFKDEDRSAIDGLLGEAGLGDAEGRQLFITAAEYEVGSLRPTLQAETETQRTRTPEPKPHSKAEIELAQLGMAAEQLIALMQQTHKSGRSTLGRRLEASDPFARRHDERYFRHLELELERLAEACRLPRAEPSAPAMQNPPASAAAEKLVAQLARIFRECLEVRLEAAQTEVFARILCVIRDSAQIRIPCETDRVVELLTDQGD
jgi:hypothetical protein